MILMQIAQACGNLGRSEDARWVLVYGLQQIPDFFTFRKPVTGPRNTAPVPWERKASPFEVESEREVDSDRYLIPTPESRKLWHQSLAASGRS